MGKQKRKLLSPPIIFLLLQDPLGHPIYVDRLLTSTFMTFTTISKKQPRWCGIIFINILFIISVFWCATPRAAWTCDWVEGLEAWNDVSLELYLRQEHSGTGWERKDNSFDFVDASSSSSPSSNLSHMLEHWF